jgi:hypothetical protein
MVRRQHDSPTGRHGWQRITRQLGSRRQLFEVLTDTPIEVIGETAPGKYRNIFIA